MSELKPCPEAVMDNNGDTWNALNQVDWFNAFQDIDDFMHQSNLYGEEDINANSPAQTLINGVTRLVREKEVAESRVGYLEGEVKLLAQGFQYTEIYAREQAEAAIKALTPPATEAEGEDG